MTSPSIFDLGTVTLTNGSAEVTGDGTAWAINGVVGGVFSCAGMSVPIVSVDDDETLTLAYPWPGSNASDVAYAISLISSQAADTIWANRHWSRVVGQALLAAIRPDASGTLAERDALNPQLANGQWFARAEPPHDLEFYRKVPAGWEGPFTTRGVGGVGEGGLGLPSPGAANKMPYYSGADTISLTDLTAFGRSLLDDADAAAARATLSVRERLTANRTYYVRTDGNNANTGLIDSAGGAFATIQHAINVVASLDLSIYNVEIVVRAGTYTAGFTFDGQWVGSGRVQLTGDIANPANVLISATTAHIFQVTSRAKIYIRGFKMQTTTSGDHVRAAPGHIVINGKMEYGESGFYQIEAALGGLVEITADYTISGNAGIAHIAVQGPSYMHCVSRTITLVGTPNWASAYAEVTGGAYLAAHANTFVGDATGVRYRVSRNGSIRASASANYFPGNADGVSSSGGQYGA